MKKAFVLAVILALVAVVSVGTVACNKPKPAEPTTTAPGGTAGQSATTAPAAAAPGVTPEVYWQIQLERQEAMKAYLTETLAIYQKYNGATPEAHNDLMALEKAHQEKMQSILTSHGLNSTADLMPSEPGRQEALQARQAFMQEHPEMREKFMAMSTEMRDLKDKITAFTTGSTPAPAPGGTTPTAPATGSTAPAAQPPAAPTPAPAGGSTAPTVPVPAQPAQPPATPTPAPAPAPAPKQP